MKSVIDRVDEIIGVAEDSSTKSMLYDLCSRPNVASVHVTNQPSVCVYVDLGVIQADFLDSRFAASVYFGVSGEINRNSTALAPVESEFPQVYLGTVIYSMADVNHSILSPNLIENATAIPGLGFALGTICVPRDFNEDVRALGSIDDVLQLLTITASTTTADYVFSSEMKEFGFCEICDSHKGYYSRLYADWGPDDFWVSCPYCIRDHLIGFDVATHFFVERDDQEDLVDVERKDSPLWFRTEKEVYYLNGSEKSHLSYLLGYPFVYRGPVYV